MTRQHRAATALTVEQAAEVQAIARTVLGHYSRLSAALWTHPFGSVEYAAAYEELLAFVYGAGDDVERLPDAGQVRDQDVVGNAPGITGPGSLRSRVAEIRNLLSDTHDFPSVGASAAATADASTPIVGAAPGVEPSTTPGATQGGAA